MLGKSPDQQPTELCKDLLPHQRNPKYPRYLFSHVIAWEKLEEDMASHYGRVSLPRHPISEMAALLMLKHRYNLSEEHVVAMCQEKAYYQYFAVEAPLQRGHPCSASDLVHCRHRLGAEGIEKLSALSMALHTPKVNKAKQVIVDTTVQEQTVTFHTDAKRYKKVIAQCSAIAKRCGLKLGQGYWFIVQRLPYAQRYAHLPKQAKKAKRALKRLKMLADRQVRHLQQQLLRIGQEKLYAPVLKIMAGIVNQQSADHAKVYSLHAPEVGCIAKGKAPKKDEFGSKGSVVSLSGSNVVVGIANVAVNAHDRKTLVTMLAQVAQWTGRRCNVDTHRCY